MNEEQKLILKMVEEGKITAEEASALLEAMNGGREERSVGAESESDVWNKLEKHGEDFAQRVETAAERFSRTLEAKLEGGLAERLTSLPKLISQKLPFVVGAEAHEFCQEFGGTFSAEAAELLVKLTTANGKIELEGWDQERFKVEVTQRIRAKDRETARQRLVEIPLDEEAENQCSLVITPQTPQSQTVSIKLFLPPKNPYKLDLTTSNGRLVVANLHAQSATLGTTNGSVMVRQVRAGTVDIRANNGSCTLDFVEGDVLRQRTGNGAIRVLGRAREIDCVTTNGSIRLNPIAIEHPHSTFHLVTTNGSVRATLPRSQDVGVAVEAVTAVGKATVDLERFESSQERHAASSRVTGKTCGFATAARKLSLTARTSSGSITISQEKEGDDGDHR